MAFKSAVPDFNPALPVIYTGWSGYRVQEFTYSMAVDIDKCGHYARSTRVEGWADILDSAGFKFGDCIETSIRKNFEEGIDAVDVFNVEWGKWKDIPLMYREREEDWTNLLQVGRAGLRQFPRIRETIFPFTNVEFSTHPVKRDWYKGSGLGYIADAIAHNPGEDVLIDIKTAGSTYPDPDRDEKVVGWPALDPQLRTGALVTGIRRVGFLVFLKLKTPRWMWIEGVVNDDLLNDQSLWLQEQYDRYIGRKFHRRAGMRFPDDHCKMCNLLPGCLGNPNLLKQTMRQKSKKETASVMDILQEME